MSARSMTDEFWNLAVASPAETADALGMPVDSVYDAIAQGAIPATRLGGRRLFVQVQALKAQLAIEVPQ